MNHRDLVGQADLHFTGTAERSEEGLPIGNGTMGTLVWTSPSSVKFAINRVDVYANGSASNSFPQIHEDFAYTCGYIDVDFAGYGGDVFDETTRQDLNVYDAAFSIRSRETETSGFLSASRDVLVLRAADHRQEPQGIEIRLRMLRNSAVWHNSHLSASSLHRMDGASVLVQEFSEDDYYCASAVAVLVSGRPGRIQVDNENGGDHLVLPLCANAETGCESETEIRTRVSPQKGSFDIYIASAATMDRTVNVAEQAVQAAQQAAEEAYERLYREHTAWWHDFWPRSYVSISGSPEVEKVSRHYTYFFYIMACSSRNANYAPNFGGLLLSPRGDHCHWGAMQWWNNLNLYYNAILPAGHQELLNPYLNMYFNMYGASETAARQTWDAEGIFIGETTYQHGLEELPEEIADELRDLLLLRKPWSERSDRLLEYASRKNPFEPRWNWLTGARVRCKWIQGKLRYLETPYGPFSYVSHLFGSMASLAYHYWLAYEYGGDLAFLRDKAYPMLRGVAEFFRTCPFTVKEADGKYHMLHSSHMESFWGAKDTLDTMTGMHGIFATAIRSAEILGVDGDKIQLWREMLQNLAPLPTTALTECDVEKPREEIFAGAAGGAVNRVESNNVPNPFLFFDLCNVQTRDVNPALFRIGMNTIRHLKNHRDEVIFNTEMSPYPRVFASMGEGEVMCDNILRQLDARQAEKEHCFYQLNGSKAVYRNRLTAREGVNALSAQRLGNVAAAVQLGLLLSTGGGPALPPVLRVFPAWKQSWDAEYRLYARGGLIVHAKQTKGRLEFVEIEATRDTRLLLDNPWENGAVLDGRTLTQARIDMPMRDGDKLMLIENGRKD